MELSVFQHIVNRHIESAENVLLNKWFPEVQKIIYQKSKHKLLPKITNTSHLLSFFNSIAALMCSQLQSLVLDSFHDYTHLIAQDPRSVRAHEHPGLVLRLILKQNQIIFEPDFNDFEVVLLNVYDTMLKCSSLVPRVETNLRLTARI
ncbi:dynein axonemal heavy chain 7-like isoform X2 [Hemibagrus wyckioides]|nr:dynein axonemal heavy chain 7-like isoform X2 [Hemibagrus wyckioides]